MLKTASLFSGYIKLDKTGLSRSLVLEDFYNICLASSTYGLEKLDVHRQSVSNCKKNNNVEDVLCSIQSETLCPNS